MAFSMGDAAGGNGSKIARFSERESGDRAFFHRLTLPLQPCCCSGGVLTLSGYLPSNPFRKFGDRTWAEAADTKTEKERVDAGYASAPAFSA